MIYNIGAISKSLREIVVDSGLLNDKNVNKHQSGGIYIQNAGDGAIYFCFNRPAELTDTVLLKGMGMYVNAQEWGAFNIISDSSADLLWILTDGDLDVHQIEPVTGGGDACCPETNSLLTGINSNIVITNSTLSTIDGTLNNIQSNTVGIITAINDLDASLSTEIQDATTAINGQIVSSSNDIITAIDADLDYAPTDTVVYWTATNAGAGYSAGDLIKEETTKLYQDNVLISSTTVYTNINTSGVITPLVTDLGALGGTSAQDNIVKLYDILPSGENIPYFAIVNSDGAGNYISHTPIIYTPTGTTRVDPLWTNIGYESINIDDTQTYTLTIPSGANHADINFIGTTGPLQPIVDYAWYQINSSGPAPTSTSGYKSVLAGQEFDIQGIDELQAFQIIAGTGMSGTINVNYKYNPNMQI